MQEEQLVAVQLAQLLEPPTGVEIPSGPLEKEEKVDNILSPLVLHLEQKASSSAHRKGRSNSNLLLQFGQKYS